MCIYIYTHTSPLYLLREGGKSLWGRSNIASELHCLPDLLFSKCDTGTKLQTNSKTKNTDQLSHAANSSLITYFVISQVLRMGIFLLHFFFFAYFKQALGVDLLYASYFIVRNFFYSKQANGKKKSEINFPSKISVRSRRVFVLILITDV